MGTNRSLYDPRFCSIANRLAKLGMIDDQIADVLGVTVMTVHNWKKRHPEFMDALSDGKALADANVAAALYQRAVGAEWVEDAVVQKTGDVVTVKRAAPPDTTACMYWLNNRQRRLWRQRPEDEAGKPDELAEVLQATARAADAELEEVPDDAGALQTAG